jgi:hypothetical protein
MDIEGTDIPVDGWAFRLKYYRATSGEELFGMWHRTIRWYRREGVVSGLVAACQRVYDASDVEVAGDRKTLGEYDWTCPECMPELHLAD